MALFRNAQAHQQSKSKSAAHSLRLLQWAEQEKAQILHDEWRRYRRRRRKVRPTAPA